MDGVGETTELLKARLKIKSKKFIINKHTHMILAIPPIRKSEFEQTNGFRELAGTHLNN